jgi:tetratricopeptide (TPR) repeat protein
MKRSVVYFRGILLALLLHSVARGQTEDFLRDEMIAAGRKALEAAQYNEADRIFARAVSAAEKQGGGPKLGYALGQLALTRIELRRYDDAARQARRGIRILEQWPDKYAWNLVSEWAALGIASYNQAYWARAAEAYQTAWGYQMRIQPVDAHACTGLLSNLTAVYTMQKRYAEAKTTLERALDWNLKYGKSDVLLKLSLLNNVGTLYSKSGDHEQARATFAQAVELLDGYKDPDGALTVAVLANLANEYEGQHRYAEAEPLYSRALTRVEQGAPVPSGIVADVLQKFRRCVQKTGTRSEVKAFDLRAAPIRSALVDNTNSLTVDVTDLARGH